MSLGTLIEELQSAKLQSATPEAVASAVAELQASAVDRSECRRKADETHQAHAEAEALLTKATDRVHAAERALTYLVRGGL